MLTRQELLVLVTSDRANGALELRGLTAGSMLALQVNIVRRMIISLFLYVLLNILLKLLHFFVSFSFLGCAPVLESVNGFLEGFLLQYLTFFLEMP